MAELLPHAQILRRVDSTKILRIRGGNMTEHGLRETLDALELTQTEAARRLRVSLRTVQNWCAGTYEVPGPVEVLVETWLRHPDLLEEGDHE